MRVNFHDHLNFYPSLEQALELINSSKTLTLANSMDLDEYLHLEENVLDKRYIKLGLGIHPFKVHEKTSLDGLDQYIKSCDFIGEIGLDFFWAEDKKAYHKQYEVFEYFIKMARKYDKITNIHTKGAEKEVLEILEKYRPRNPIIHWYSGDLDFVKRYLDLGAYFTISVDAGYSKLTDELIEILPLDRILTETDGPTSLSWVLEELKINSEIKIGNPDYIKNVNQYVARKKGISLTALEEKILENYKALKL